MFRFQLPRCCVSGHSHAHVLVWSQSGAYCSTQQTRADDHAQVLMTDCVSVVRVLIEHVLKAVAECGLHLNSLSTH